jgi:hypothetical protein
MKEAFTTRRLNAKSRVLVDAANLILEEMHDKGYTMTLRQLHYQFVARNVVVSLPNAQTQVFYSNTQKSYKRLGKVISEARLAGLVDWSMMEDRVRSLEGLNHWDSPQDILDGAAQQYRTDRWDGQKWRPEVWIEKDALAGVIEGVCNRYRVRFFACRGYVSQSAQYEASKRFLDARNNGQEPIVFHLGDHDPSGLDMSRENRAKFELLTGESVELKRLALNHNQVRRYNPPANPAKMGDTRAPKYVREFGKKSWELDALSPEIITKLIEDAIKPLINQRAWGRAVRKENMEKNQLQKVSLNWADIIDQL